MRKLQLLKTILDFIWYFSIIAIIGMAIFIPYMFFSNEFFDIPIEINGNRILVIDLSTKIILTLDFFSYCFFIYGILKLRKILTLFSKLVIFDDINVLLLNQIGRCFLMASLFSMIPLFAYKLIQKNNSTIDFGGGFGSFLFTASLSLFFMVLSEVFKISKTIKEENDLTI